MSKSAKQLTEADVAAQRSDQSSTADPSTRADGPETKATGQKVSLERGKATHKKNPGKRAKAGGS